jgi:hypothetical protein
MNKIESLIVGERQHGGEYIPFIAVFSVDKDLLTVGNGAKQCKGILSPIDAPINCYTLRRLWEAQDHEILDPEYADNIDPSATPAQLLRKKRALLSLARKAAKQVRDDFTKP